MPDPIRQALWAEAERLFFARAGSAKFLHGTHSDRQTGAVKTHRYRLAFGVKYPAPKDHARLYTRGADGASRWTAWQGHLLGGLKTLTPVAVRIRLGKWRPGPLMIARWPEPGRTRPREIAFPGVLDRLVMAVLLEVLEPVIDPVLSPWQHGYRSTYVGGIKIEVPAFPGIPRGSIDIVARRLYAAARSGFIYIVELDISNAFLSVNRDRLRAMLIEDGCSPRFAMFIIRSLGSEAVDPDQPFESVPVTGIPLGNPVGPLLFNFYVKGVHDQIPSGDSVLVQSYADNVFVASKTEAGSNEAVEVIQKYLQMNLGLGSKIKQTWSPTSGGPGLHVLDHQGDGWLLGSTPTGDIYLRRPVGKDISRRGDGPLPVGGHGVSPVSPPLEDGSPHGFLAGPLSCNPGQCGEREGNRIRCGEGDHRPVGIRSGRRAKPDSHAAEPDPADGHRPEAPSDLGRNAHAPASDTDGSPAGGGGAPADLVFPDDPEGVAALLPALRAIERAHVVLTVPTPDSRLSWAVAARRLRATWDRLSRHMVGHGIRHLTLYLPVDARMITTPGLFGVPTRVCAVGDDHWRVIGSPELKTDEPGTRLEMALHCIARLADEVPYRALVRHGGSHLVAFASPIKRGFRCSVTGFIRSADGTVTPCPVFTSSPRPNPTTAVAEALALALESLPSDVEFTIWTSDNLVRAAVRGYYIDATKTRFRGVRPPDIQRALVRLLGAVSRRAARVHLRKATPNGAVMSEVIARRFVLAVPDWVEQVIGAVRRALPTTTT